MNWAVDPEERARRDRVRVKLLVAILVGYGYAVLGGALWEPRTADRPFTAANILLIAVGLAMHGVALYLSPRGEP